MMLVEFSVENHRVFREKQTFSMVTSAATERSTPNRVAQTGFAAVPHLLREACLFGANGSGKSSLIDAMNFVARFVHSSFNKEAGSPIPVEPFAFHSEWRKRQSEFEIVFIEDDVLYQYGFAVTHERVTEEWLFARPKTTGRQRHIFTRAYDEAKDLYDWDISNLHLKGERDSWRTQTRPDALFLSTAVQLNADGLRGAHNWLTQKLRLLGATEAIFRDDYTQSRFTEDGWPDRVIDFLRKADIAIHGIVVNEKDIFETAAFARMPKELQEMIKHMSQRQKIWSVKTVRLDEIQEPVVLGLEEESSGTRSLFHLAGPIIDVLDNGYVLVVDELNSGLHPLAFQHLIEMFCDPDINKRGAQLIFTTHDTSVAERNCVGRDQIWLVEKDHTLAASLTPFSDFKTRDGRSFQKGYLQGRYGGVPKISG